MVVVVGMGSGNIYKVNIAVADKVFVTAISLRNAILGGEVGCLLL